MGTPASINANVLPQVLAIELEPLDSSTSDIRRMVYGNSSVERQYGSERAFGERAVADLTTAGAAHRANLAHAVRREVILMHVALFAVRPDIIERLALAHAAERQHGQHLRLSAQ